MNKIKNNISAIIFFFVIFIFNILVVKTKGISNIDFLWVFGSCNDILEGLVPYRDFNIILFPLFYASMAPFSGSIMSYYVFGSIFYALLSTMIFKYVKNLRIPLLLLMLAKILSIEFWEYNMLMIFFIIFSFISLKEYYKKDDGKYLFLTGLFLCLALLTKHNAPAIVIIFLTIFLTIRCLQEKKYKDFVMYAIGGLLPAIVLIICSLIFGFFSGMMDLAVLGIVDFAAIGDLHSAVIICYVLVLFLSIAIMYLCYKNMSKNIMWAFIYIIAGFQIIRVADISHIIHGVVYWGLLLIIILQDFDFSFEKYILSFKKEEKKELSIVYVCCVFILTFSILLIGFCSFMNYVIVKDRSNYYFSNSGVYDGVKIDDALGNRIEKISEYIQAYPEENIVVMSEVARGFSLYLDEHWGVIDMNLLYNGGTNGRNKIIEELYNYDKVIYYPTESLFIDIEIYQYIKDHFDVCDTIIVGEEEFKVYEINK